MQNSLRVSSLLCGAAVLMLAPASAIAQAPSAIASAGIGGTPPALAERLAGMPDGTVRLTFPAKAGTCGNGARAGDVAKSIVSDGTNRYAITGKRTPVSFEPGLGRGIASWCEAGNVNVALTVQQKKVTDARTYVGGFGKADAKGGQDVGTVSAAEAVDYLLGLTGTLDKAAIDRVLLAAMLADSVELTQRFVALALDRSKPVVARERAVWFLAQLEGEEVSTALAGLLRDTEVEQWLREAAQRGIIARVDASRRS